jgi:hypothetical protein
MIVKEFFKIRSDGVKLYRTYSNKGLVIRKLGTEEEYDDAVDIENAQYEYVETTKPIEQPEGEV